MRVLIECGNQFGDNCNLGDIAMYTVLLRRLREAAPGASIHLTTRDPDLVRRIFPGVEPLELGEPAPLGNWMPDEFTALCPELDIVLMSGGGCFTDAFAHSAWRSLGRVGVAMEHGAAGAVVGMGFETVSDPSLRAVAAEVLPRLGVVACRESLRSPAVLAHLGVSSQPVVVTGDDAVELGLESAPSRLGGELGLNFRAAPYAGIDEQAIRGIGRGVRAASERLGARIAPLVVSTFGPDDADAIALSIDFDLGMQAERSEAPGSDLTALVERTSRCRVVVAGSYHQAVLSLAQGIPVVALAGSDHYRCKFEGLQHGFGRGCTIVDVAFPRPGQATMEAIDAAWAEADEIRDELLAAAQRQVHAGRSAFSRILAQPRRERVRKPPSRSLSREQLRAFDQAGFLGPMDLLSAAETAQARDALGPILGLDAGQWSQRHLDDRSTFDLSAHPRLLEYVGSLLGPDIVLWNSRFRVKGSGARMIPWHQDDAYWRLEPSITVSACLALDDADGENACLELIPGSHRQPLAHSRTEEEVHDDFHPTTDRAEGARTVTVPMRAGQALLLSPRVVHRSAPNPTQRRRAALVMRYAPPQVRILSPPIAGVILVSGVDRFGNSPLVDPPLRGTGHGPPADADFAFDRPFRGGGMSAREAPTVGSAGPAARAKPGSMSAFPAPGPRTSCAYR